MPPNPPQTLSVKRKRNDLPVDSLIYEKRLKIQTKETTIWRLVQKPDIVSPLPLLSPTQSNRRFIFDPTAGRRRVFVEERTEGENIDKQQDKERERKVEVVRQETPRPRKRPGAGSAVTKAKLLATEKKAYSASPSEEVVRQFELFSEQIEKEEAVKPVTSPSKFKPKTPKLRYKDRHPEQSIQNGKDQDMMDIDTEEYVYDTYIREVVMADADGKIPEPQGTVGVIVINEEDEDWWNEDAESDKEFDTDDEDENAEDYYANDYPEDEVSSDDEFDRDPYKYRYGGEDEECDLEEIRSDVEDDEPFCQTVPTIKRTGYWGRVGE